MAALFKTKPFPDTCDPEEPSPGLLSCSAGPNADGPRTPGCVEVGPCAAGNNRDCPSRSLAASHRPETGRLTSSGRRALRRLGGSANHIPAVATAAAAAAAVAAVVDAIILPSQRRGVITVRARCQNKPGQPTRG